MKANLQNLIAVGRNPNCRFPFVAVGGEETAHGCLAWLVSFRFVLCYLLKRYYYYYLFFFATFFF
jgi:hypothetical protein